jgi:hypothetical protein
MPLVLFSRFRCRGLALSSFANRSVRPPYAPWGLPFGTFCTCVSLVVLAAFVAVCIIAIIVSLCNVLCTAEYRRVFGHVAIFAMVRTAKAQTSTVYAKTTMFDDCKLYFLRRESLGI